MPAREKWKQHSKHTHVFAIVRLDLPVDSGNVSDRVNVVKVYPSESLAASEVERLNKVNSGKGCVYFMRITHMIGQQG